MQNAAPRVWSLLARMTLSSVLALAASDCSRIETLLTEPIIVTVVRCPPMKDYAPEMQKQASADLAALPPASPVRQLVADYGTQRAKCRAYENKTAKP